MEIIKLEGKNKFNLYNINVEALIVLYNQGLYQQEIKKVLFSLGDDPNYMMDNMTLDEQEDDSFDVEKYWKNRGLEI